MRQLLVNADDFNLTPGVAHAILKAHDHGIVSSTSIFANLDLPLSLRHDLIKRKKLGVGLHLNATLAKPLVNSKIVSSLLGSDGTFKRPEYYQKNEFRSTELELEFRGQIRWFHSVFGRWPDHLNTHHHIHEFPYVFHVVAKLGFEYGIPIRRIQAFRRAARNFKVCVSDYFFGNLSAKKYWTETSLISVLENLPEGISEIMCHPGVVDSDLKKISSFTKGRKQELQLFSKPSLKVLLKKEGIELIPRLRYNTPPCEF